MSVGLTSTPLEQAEKIIDIHGALVTQIKRLTKEQYLAWVHTPYYFGKEQKDARLFESDFFEFFSHTHWWVVPCVWLPIAAFLWLPYLFDPSSTVLGGLALFVAGLLLWTVLEYFVHRFIFHLDEWLPDNKICLTVHFIMHGIHHKVPMDPLRLVMPPALFAFLWAVLGPCARATVVAPLSAEAYWAVTGAIIFGYVAYDMLHYAEHHASFQPDSHFDRLKRYHMKHHGLHSTGFGVSTTFWDHVFGTTIHGFGERKRTKKS